jgi:tetratricopeptide (TPR) repeat protein
MAITSLILSIYKSGGHIPLIPSSFNAVTENTYIYDEGMSMCFTPMNLPIQSLHSEKIVQFAIQFNLGICYAIQRKDEDAFVYFSRCLPLLNPLSNPQDAIILWNMGQIAYRTKDYKKSEAFFMEALGLSKTRYGKCHKEVALILNALGVVALNLGSSKCREYLTEALQIREQLALDSYDDPDFATLNNNLGRANYFLKDYVNAIFYFERAYAIRSILFDAKCPDVTVVEYNLGQANQRVGNALTALYRFQSTISKMGDDDSNVTNAHIQIASIFSERKDFHNAIKHYSLALEHTKRFNGEISSRASYILNQMGNIYYELDDLTSALNIYLEGLWVEYKVIPLNSHDIITTLCNIANIYQKKRDLHQALKYYNEALEIQKTTSDKPDLSVAEILSHIAHCHDHLDNYYDAISCYEYALSVRVKILGGSDYTCSTILNAIGVIWYKQGVLDVALKTFQDSLDIRRNKNCQDRDLAIVLYNKACVELDMGNVSQALIDLIESLHDDLAHSSIDVHSMFSALEMIGYIFEKQGDFDQALTYFFKGVSFGISNATIPLSDIAKLLSHIGGIYLQRGDDENAIEVFTEIGRLNWNDGVDESTRLKIFDFLDHCRFNLPCAPAA